MTRGVKVVEFPAPSETWCDFCGRRFKPLAWNERTCYRCGVDGWPNQSKLQWRDYIRQLYAFLRAIGRKAMAPGLDSTRRKVRLTVLRDGKRGRRG